MIDFSKDGFRFYSILLLELMFLPFLYLKNFLFNRLSSRKDLKKNNIRKEIETDQIYVNIHEWGGYNLERSKKVSVIPDFDCGLRFQLERFNNAKKNLNIFLNVTLSEPNLHHDLLFIENNCDNLDFVDNNGMDFSGYSFFYENIKNRKNAYVILTNSSVNKISTDFLKDYIEYMDKHKEIGILGVSYCSKMIQTLIKNNFTPHIQSFFYLTTIDVLKQIVKKNKKFPGKGINHKLLLIREGEIKVSKLVQSLGYQLAVVTEKGDVQHFGKNCFWDNGRNRWKLKIGDARLFTKFPNKINTIKKKNLI